MSRRNPKPLEQFADLLIKLPPWVSLALGVAGFAGIQWFHYTHLPPKVNVLWAVNANSFSALALALFVAMAMASAIHRHRRGRTLEQQTGLETLRSTPWKDFEYLVAEAYRRQGFAVDYSLDTGPDGGVDIVLRKAGRKSLVQCKRWKQMSVGVAVAREMFGILHDQKADDVIIVTTGGFTPDAEAFAKGKAMTLIDGPRLWEIVQGVQTHAVSTERSQENLSATDSRATVVETTEAPACPTCRSPMVMRTAKRGASAGNSFWGCQTFPVCKGTRAVG